MIERDSLLWTATLVHVVLAALCCAWLATQQPAIGGVHPGLKPFKFSIATALLLGTLAYVLPAIDMSLSTRQVLAVILVVAVAVEMLVIVGQALRGEASHFNTRTSLNATLWSLMGLAATVIALVVLAIALIALVRTIDLPPMLAVAVRIGLMLVVLTAISGFAMGGRSSHTVHGVDGTTGDLRVPHFFALHGLQALPLVAILVSWLPLGERPRWGIFGLVTLTWISLAVGTLVQALAGRPFRL